MKFKPDFPPLGIPCSCFNASDVFNLRSSRLFLLVKPAVAHHLRYFKHNFASPFVENTKVSLAITKLIIFNELRWNLLHCLNTGMQMKCDIVRIYSHPNEMQFTLSLINSFDNYARCNFNSGSIINETPQSEWQRNLI